MIFSAANLRLPFINNPVTSMVSRAMTPVINETTKAVDGVKHLGKAVWNGEFWLSDFITAPHHELGHYYTAKLFGLEPELSWTRVTSEKEMTSWQDIVVSAAGPFANLLSAGVVSGILYANGIQPIIDSDASYVWLASYVGLNLLSAVVNLNPFIMGSDGWYIKNSLGELLSNYTNN